MSKKYKTSHRVKNLPPYVFSKLNEKKQYYVNAGVDVIDLGIGAPDLPTPPFIIEQLIKQMNNPKNFTYSTYNGCLEFRESVALFYKKRFNVTLDPEEEILTLIGSKEGIAHFVFALIDPGNVVLVPDPGYPVYRMATKLANGHDYSFPLKADNGFQPDFNLISNDVKQKAKLMFLNYPGNPTASVASEALFEEAITFGKENQIAVANDSAYHLITFEDYKAPSILQVDGAKEIAVEFGSLSKSFNMAGWRIGYVVGNKEMLKALSIVKSNIDTSQFLPIQLAAAAALSSDSSFIQSQNNIYKKRMEIMFKALRTIGIHVLKPRATFFLWASVPDGFTSASFAETMLEKAGIIVTPGNAFGKGGEGYFRVSLSVSSERLIEAAERIKKNF